MRRLSVFNILSLDGFYEGRLHGDISWHKHGEEEHAYSREQLKNDIVLLFGRVTYELMAAYWPTPIGEQDDAFVADVMNKSEKIVFSRTMKKADWNNTTVVSANIAEEVRKMKQQSGKNMMILGSGNIVAQFAQQGLIDEYIIMLDPVALGGGSSMFNNLKEPLKLKLTGARPLNSGAVILRYEPRT